MKQLSIVLGGLFILTACTSTPGVRIVEQVRQQTFLGHDIPHDL